jgi:hypothetical protein
MARSVGGSRRPIARVWPAAFALALARDSVVPVPLLGRTIAGLAEAIRVHLANETPASAAERVLTIAGELSAAGQIVADAPAPFAGVAFPRALLLRMVRYLEVAGQILDAGGTVEGLDGVGVARLAAAFHDNSAELRATTR